MVEQKKYERRFIVSLFLIIIWFPCYSQQKQIGCYEINGINGERSIYINGIVYYDYMNIKKWETKKDFKLFDEDIVKVTSNNAYIGLLKDNKFIGCLCHASNSEGATVKESLDLLCQVDENGKLIDKGVTHERKKTDINKGSDEYYDALRYILYTYLPQRDSSDWVKNEDFLDLDVTSHNDGTVLYDVLFESDTCLISTDNPFFLRKEDHIFYPKIPDDSILFVHIFWQVFDEYNDEPNELNIEKPIFHYSIIWER